MAVDLIVVLDTTIPAVSDQILACCFGCEYAKMVDQPDARCAPHCYLAEQIQRKHMENNAS